MSRTRSIRIAAALAGLAVVLAGLYTAWWFVLAGKWQEGIDRWTAMVAKQGWTVTTGAIAVSGFPGAIRFDLAAPQAHDTAGNSWSGPPSALFVSPFAPLDPRFAAPGAHRFAVAGLAPVDIAADSVAGHIEVARGRPTALIFEAQHATSGEVILDRLDLDLHRLSPPAADNPTAPVLALIASMNGLALPEGLAPALDRTIAAAHLALRLRGLPPPGTLKESLAAWRDAGGTLEVDSFDLDWPPIAAAGNATLALDKEMQPELAGTVIMRGLPAAIDRAVAIKLMPPGPGVAAKVVLGLTAREGPDGAPENKVAVTVQNRLLTVGPIKLMQMPEVKW